MLQSHDGDRNIVTAKSAKVQPTTGPVTPKDHSFVILQTFTLSNGQRLVKMRNPWGREMWNGAWSDSAPQWTPQFKQEVGFEANNEGTFFMSVEDLYTRLEATFVNYDTADWTLCYYAMFDDPAERNGEDPKCGSGCTRHSLTVTSEADQTIWIGVHTWQYYGYAKDRLCPAPSNDHLNAMGLTGDNLESFVESSLDKKNIVVNQTTRDRMGWENGTNWLPSMVVSRGEAVDIAVEFNWEREGLTHDWSVTVWGEVGGVSVTHNDGIASDSLPYVPIGARYWESSDVGTSPPVAPTHTAAAEPEDAWAADDWASWASDWGWDTDYGTEDFESEQEKADRLKREEEEKEEQRRAEMAEAQARIAAELKAERLVREEARAA